MSPIKFEIFLISHNFLRSSIIWQIRWPLAYHIYHTRYQVSFSLWQIGPIEKYFKAQKKTATENLGLAVNEKVSGEATELNVIHENNNKYL